MTTDWIVRAGDGKNFKNSSKFRIWGITSTTSTNKHFIKNVKPGDRLWFIEGKSKGKIIAVTTYQSHNMRKVNNGPLIDTSLTDEDLGWSGSGTDWSADVEVHYTDLQELDKNKNKLLFTHIKGAATIRKYNEKCRVNLAEEYITFKL